jgi:hypothetical protein
MTPYPYLLFARMTLLALEAQQVIWLRMLRLAAGGAVASREWQRMTSEKALAAMQIGASATRSLALGKPNDAVAQQVVRGYRSRVSKNRRRLTKH